MVEFAAQRSETKSVCLSFSAGPWRKTKRKARSFKRQSAGPPRLELILFANVAGQDASVWRWHHPPPNPFSSPFFSPAPFLLLPSSCPLSPALSASTAALLLPATRGGYWGYYGYVRRWRGGVFMYVQSCHHRAPSLPRDSSSKNVFSHNDRINGTCFRKAKPILLF